jgi:hypothetical protein
MEHVDNYLKLLRENQLFMKHSKCSFGNPKVEYLGHIVIQEGVKVDPKKMVAMQDWHCTKKLNSLKGFLGLHATIGNL